MGRVASDGEVLWVELRPPIRDVERHAEAENLFVERKPREVEHLREGPSDVIPLEEGAVLEALNTWQVLPFIAQLHVL